MTTDPIADMLTRIRNGLQASKSTVLIPHSKIKLSIANILLAHGYIAKIDETKLGEFAYLEVTLSGAKKSITSIIRISKPGRRLYAGKQEIPTVLSGRGMVIISTPSGLMSGQDARKNGIGGELICKIW